jgi:DNA-binding response OmpR family regulator
VAIKEHDVVLLVEDDLAVRDFVKDILTKEKLSVHTAVDGKDGIQQAIALHPDLILLDLRMPKLDGVTFCRAIRAGTETKDIPIIVMTAFNSRAQLEEAITAGADDFIGKPFDVNDLVFRVRAMLKWKQIPDHVERIQRYILTLRQPRPAPTKSPPPSPGR